MHQSLSVFSSTAINKYYVGKCVASLLFASIILSMSILSMPIANAESAKLDSIVLSVHGNIEGKKNDIIELDLLSLTQLESTTITTNQPWTDEPKEYTGVRVSTLLNHIGATSSEFEALASNEYKFVLSGIDFEKYPIIVAYKIDGEFLETRKLGPLLIIFPFDDYPELLTESNKAASVWQLIEMRIL